MCTFFPGTRVIVFDSREWLLKRNSSKNFKPATVVSWYGKKYNYGNGKDIIYPSLIDVKFDDRLLNCEVSRAHFTTGVKIMEDQTASLF